MTAEYSSAAETVRRALRMLREEGLVATQSTRGTFVLKDSPEREASPDVTRLEAEIHDTEARLTQRLDEEIAKLRDELEYTQAQVMALGGDAPGRAAAPDKDVGT